MHDLCAAKLLAGRPKDRDFVAAVVGARLADPVEIGRLLEAAVVGEERRMAATATLAQLEGSGLPARSRRAWWRRRADALADRVRQAPRPRPVVLLDEAPEGGPS